jgi:hypothetical protein
VLKEIRERADKALDFKLVTVVDKPSTPPSGDKHDYMSLSPYWWPDKTKPMANRSFRKDGEINPDRDKYDLPHMEAMADAVGEAGDGVLLHGRRTYAEELAADARVVLRSRDAHEPQLPYAQFIPGVEEKTAPPA